MKNTDPRVRNLPVRSAIPMWMSRHIVGADYLIKTDVGNYYGHMNRAAYYTIVTEST
jgi:hypothetical protein